MRKNHFFLFSLMVVALMSATIFASVVSDNDGSAFITKAEFDSLKNNFQAQIDQYNTSIDSKIDVAIASYLAGVSVASQQQLTNYIEKAKKNSEDNLKFMKWATPSDTRAYGDSKKYYDVEAAYVVGQIWGVNQDSNQSQSGLYSYTNVSNASAWGAEIRYADYLGTDKNNSNEWTGKVKDYKSAYYWIKFPFKGKGTTYKNTTDWVLKDIVRHRLHMKLEAAKIGFTSAQTGNYTGDAALKNLPLMSSATLETDFSSFTQPGIKQGASQGTQVVLELKPMLTMTHNWSQFDEDSDFSDQDDEKTNVCLKYNISGTIADKKIAGVEYEKRDYYESDAITNTIMTKPKPNNNLNDGSRPGTSLGFRWRNYMYYSRVNASEYYNTFTFNFKYKNPKYYNLNYKNLTNEYYNTLFGKAHYKYYGVPLTNVVNTGKLTFYLTFNNSTANDYKYCIMDKKFDNGNMPASKKETLGGISYERVLKTDIIKGTKGEKKVKFELEKKAIFDKENGDYIYIKIEPSNATQIVSVDCTEKIMLESYK